MLKHLTYRQKNLWLLIAFAIFAALSYQMAIRKTVRLFGDNAKTKLDLKSAATAPAKLNQLNKKLESLEYSFTSGSEKAENDELLAKLTSHCKANHLKLRSFPSPNVTEASRYTISTIPIKVEGSFNNLLKLAYKIEQEYNMGHVASIDFNKQKDKRTKRTFLEMTIHLQQITKSISG